MTIKKIAELAGVSIGTVDRVIHGRGRVSKNTEATIKQIIQERGYKPNIFASNLSMSKSYVFGILMPNKDQDSNYWSIPITGIEKAQRELSMYNISVRYFFFDRHNDSSFVNAWTEMRNSQIDGLLIAPTITSLARDYIENSLPENLQVIIFDSFIPECNCLSYIGQDPHQSGVVSAKLMKMLIDENSEIAIVRVRPDDFHISERAKGFQGYFANKNDYSIKVYNIYNSDNTKEFNEVAQKITDENKKLSGIFVTNAATHYIAKKLKALTNTKKVHLIGYDLIAENMKYLEEGFIDFLISQKPKLQGYQGIYALYRAIVLREKIHNNIMVPIDILTKENIQYYNIQNYIE